MNAATAIVYRDRIIELLQGREDIKEITGEMRSKGATEIEIAGIRQAAARALWDQKRRQRVEAIGQYVLQLETETAIPQAAD